MKFSPDKAQPVTQEQIIGIIDQIGKNYPKEYSAVLKGIAQQESGFKNIQGRANKQDHGVFQINEINLKKGNLNPYDPVEAAKFAFDLLDKNVRSTGSLESGITAYNAGAGRVNAFQKGTGKPLHDIQRRYAAEVMARSNQFQPGIFDMNRIDQAAKKFGYNGKADFVALAGGKKNLSNAPMVAQQEPSFPSIQPTTDIGSSVASISQAQQAPAAPIEPMNMDAAIASLQPEMPMYQPEQESQLASAFGFEPDASPLKQFGLPSGLLEDVKRAVAAA